MNKRADGLGTVTEMPDGRFRARGPRQPDGTRPSLGIHPTREEAERETLLAAVLQRSAKKSAPTNTFEKAGLDILAEREKVLAIRDSRNELSRFRNHLATAGFSQMDPRDIRPIHIAAWLRAMSQKKANDRRQEREIDRETISRALSLASAIFDALGPQGRGLIPSNPCLGMKVKKRAGKEATVEKSTWLRLAEQEWFSLPRVTSNGFVFEHERFAILFSCSGIRFGEQFNLELSDLHEDDAQPHARIRYGSNGGPLKNDKIYDVDLFGWALIAARQWRKLLPSFCPHNYDELVWPTEQGSRRRKPLGNGHFRLASEMGQRGTHVLVSGKPKRALRGQAPTHVYVDRFHEVMRIAGISRRIRWHDMRHTTGTSLVSGEWGAPWSLEEVRAQLNHSSITVTQRYAKMSPGSRKRAVAKVTFVGHALDTATKTEASGNEESP